MNNSNNKCGNCLLCVHTYVVSLSNDESGMLSQGNNRAFVVELSNGTKFITIMNMQNVTKTTVLLSETGETLNALADTAAYIHAADNIGAYNRHSAIN